VELRREQALELPTPARRLALVLALAALVLPFSAAADPKAPVYDSHGNLIGTPFVPQDQPEPAELTDKKAIAAVLAYPKVADWVDRYPAGGLTKQATLDEDAGTWSVKIWSELPDAGQIVDAKVDDQTAEVTEAWTGPQVAWKMARGYDGAFGRGINRLWLWLTFCVVFFVGLADFRRIASVRNLDLVVLLSFSVSLYYFNRGEIFTSVPLVYPGLAYLLGRMIWVGARGGSGRSRPLWPAWVLLAATVFLFGMRTTLNVVDSNVIDVGLAGIDGGQRIVQGEMPYGHMPTDDGKACGLPDADGYVREHVQTNGRCESANERGDTYGPMAYIAYVPAYLILGFDGKWNGGSGWWGGLPAAHLTSLLWDLAALIGMGLLGLRFGGRMLGASLAFAWAAYPFTQYVSNSNSNDAIMPALLVWGLVFLTSPPTRGFFLALGAWTKFAALLLLPLWASYPDWRGAVRSKLTYLLGFVLGTLASFWILFLEANPLHAGRIFWDRTFGWQLSRSSPFSIWDWDEYPGYPDLHHVQTGLKVALLLGALALYFVPRVKSEVQIAALTAALLIGFEVVLTHWFYLYIPWFFPFVAFALLAPALMPARAAEPAEPPPELEHEPRALVPTS
jgi:hypothetical protein